MTTLQNQILWISSMSPSLYQVYGKDLIQSFEKYHPDQHLWITYDTIDPPCKFRPPFFQGYSLTQSRLLKKFTKHNRDYIPVEYGGNRRLKELYDIHKYNGRWYNWFKKVHTLFLAVEHFNFHKKFRYLVWVDCDCVFVDKFPVDQFITKVTSKNYLMGYFYGAMRSQKNMGVESGLVLFDTLANNSGLSGKDLILKWHQIYWDQSYRKYPRWDDGYLLKVMLENLQLLELNYRKLSYDYGIESKARDSHVMKGCFWWKYLQHRKGNSS